MAMAPEPLSIRLNEDATAFFVEFEDGKTFELSAEYLRVYSPSAEVQGHAPEQAKLQTGKKNVKIRKVEPIGDYAVAIVFDDGHSTGIYSWEYLYTLGTEQDVRWPDYLARLEAAGASREP